MKVISRLYRWYGKRVVWGVGALLIVLVVASVVLGISNGNTTEESDERLRSVEVASVASLSGSDGLSLVGEIEAVSQAEVTSEVSGRIVSVPVRLGDSVRAGQILAQFENSRERASVLQAEGAYEAAVAAASRSTVSLNDAYVTTLNDYRKAFITTQSVMQNTVESFFDRGTQISLDIEKYSWERSLINYDLDDWNEATLTLTPDSSVVSSVDEAESIVRRASVLVDNIFEQVLSKENKNLTAIAPKIPGYKTDLTNARSQLANALSTLTTAKTRVADAELTAAREESGEILSTADAQVKQALGSLRLAESALAKTIVRAPIGGVVNAVDVKVGDFVGVQNRVAMVANNDALQITTFISEQDRDRVAVGDVVTINGTYEGIVSVVAPAIDPATKKIEVQISTESEKLSNGDTVRIAIASHTETISELEEIVVPITALKVETDRTVTFTVNGDGTLVAHPVEIGPLLGDRVIIFGGITGEMEIVRDARGLNEGDRVEAVRG